MSDILEKIVIVLGGSLLVFLVVGGLLLLSSFLTMWAWNVFMVGVFHLPAVNFWQALAFNLLANAFRAIIVNRK